MKKRLTAIQKWMRKSACLKHTGKMTDLISISTSPYNWLCNLRAKIIGSICSHCFSRRMMKRYPALAAKLQRNAAFYSHYDLNPEDVYIFNPKSGYFRFEAYIIFSVAGLNSEFSEVIYDALQATGYGFIDKVFTVFDHDNGHINCGAKACAKCGLCYTKNETVFVNELLK